MDGQALLGGRRCVRCGSVFAGHRCQAGRAETVCSRDCSDLNQGRACPWCGHWSGLHPGVHNPALASCALCEMRQPGELLGAAPAFPAALARKGTGNPRGNPTGRPE